MRNASVSSSPVFANWISFSCLTAQAKTSSTALNECGGDGGSLVSLIITATSLTMNWDFTAGSSLTLNHFDFSLVLH